MSFLDSIGSFFGGLFGGPPDIPATTITVAESKVQAYDPLAPRTLCLGRSAWSTSIGWQKVHSYGSGASTPRDSLTQILCAGSHTMGPLEEILIGDKIYTVGTTFTAGGDDFVPASLDNGSWDFDSIYGPAGWYVPNRLKGQKFHRLDGGVRRSALIFKWYDGSHTTQVRNDDWLEHIAGWTNVTRDFRGEAVLALTWRLGINDTVFGGTPPRLMPISQGAQNIHRWSPGTVGYTNRALDCFTHWMMWEYGPFQEVNDSWAHVALVPADWDAAIMAAESSICEQNVADGDRYVCSYQIHSGQDAQEVYDTFDFLCGGLRVWQRANGLWAARVGSDRAAVVQFILDGSTAEASSIRTRRHRAHADKWNTIRVAYVSDTNLYEKAEAEKSDSAYRNADGGVKLLETITNDGRHNAASNKRLGLIKLDRHRLEEGVSFDIWYRYGEDKEGTPGGFGGAMRCEPGDIAEITYSRRGWTQKEFEIVNKSYDPATGMYSIECEEWGAIRFDGVGDTPEEVGDDVGNWDGRLEKPTGLAVVSAGQPATTMPDGGLSITALVDCDDHPEEALVEFLGGYSFRWRDAIAEGKWTTKDADESRTTASGLIVGLTYEFQARVFTRKGGSVKSEWTNSLVVDITSDFIGLPGPVAGTDQGQNLIADWDFERSAGLGPTESPYWDSLGVPSHDGIVTFLATGGIISPATVEIETVTTDQTVKSRRRIPVQPGSLYRVAALVRDVGNNTNPQYAIKLLGRDINDRFLVDIPIAEEIYAGGSNWKRAQKIAQIPWGAFTPLFPIEAEAETSGTGATATLPTVTPKTQNRLALAWVAHNANITVETPPTGEVGGTWNFRARNTTASGDAVGHVVYEAVQTTGAPISGGSVTQNAGTTWGALAGALYGVAGTTPSFVRAGELGAAVTNTVTNVTVQYPDNMVAGDVGDVLLVAIAIHADSGRTCVPTDSRWRLVDEVTRNDLSLFVFSTENDDPILDSNQPTTFDWNGTGGVPVAQGGPVLQYTNALARIVSVNLELRGKFGTDGSNYRFDAIEMFVEQTVPSVVNGATIGPYNSVTTGGRRTVVVSQYHYGPPLGYVVQITGTFTIIIERVQAGATTASFYVELRRQRESDGIETTLISGDLEASFKGSDGVGDKRKDTTVVRYTDELTGVDVTTGDRYRWRIIGRLEAGGNDFTWIARARNLTLRFAPADVLTESGGDPVT